MEYEFFDNDYIGKKIITDKNAVSFFYANGNNTIGELCERNSNLLIFPYCLDKTNDKIASQKIFDIQYNKGSILVRTSNIMGYLGNKNVKVKISSRFKNGERDYFLHYILSRVFNINILNYEYGFGKDELLCILYIIYPLLLNEAIKQGIYKEYKTFNYHNECLKGKLSISNFIKKDTPFLGKFSYSAREYTSNNYVLHLIRHTIEYINKKHIGRMILNSNRETRKNIELINSITIDYEYHDRKKIISENIKQGFKHPYYDKYKKLQILSLIILLNGETAFNITDNLAYGILFDGAWLWEEYLWTILKKIDFIHPENKTHKRPIFIFDDNTGERFPDYYRQKSIKQDILILDAKYKYMKDKLSHVDRNDLNQIITYMYITKAKRASFIFPEKNKQKGMFAKMNKNSYGGEIGMVPFNIPIEETNYPEFCKNMENNEKLFVNLICRI